VNSSANLESEFRFGFDDPIGSVSFTRTFRLSGWLVNTKGKSINGIRLVARNSLWPRRVVRGRRKRSRPDVAAQFPDLPDTYASGFLIEAKLRPGCNRLLLQVQDHERHWRTFFSAELRILPLDYLRTIGLQNVHDHLLAHLQIRQRRKLQPIHDRTGTTSFHPAVEFAGPSPTSVAIYASARSNLFIREVGQLVAAGFSELGLDTALLFDQLPTRQSGRVLQLVLTPHEYYNLFLLNRVPRRTARDLTRQVVLLSTEQPGTSWFRQNLRWAPYARAVADINPLGVASYREHGIGAHRLALGFHEFLCALEIKSHAERTIDITFLGSLTPRRDAFFARHADFFSQRDCHLRFVPLGFAKTELSRSYLPAAERNALLNRSRILLNLHYSDQQYFEWHRMLLGLANGCCIVTENCAGYGPLIPNKHFIMVDTDALMPACEYYLENPDECARIASAGHDFVQHSLRQSHRCQEFLRSLGQSLPPDFQFALVDDPPAIALPSSLTAKLEPTYGHGLWSAFGKDLRKLFSRSHNTEETTPAVPPAEQDLNAMRESVVAKRIGYYQRRREQETRRQAGDDIWMVHDNTYFAGSSSPQLSILVTLYNYGRFIEGCIAAVDRAADNLPASTELIVVDDASTDDSLLRARRAQARLQRPLRIVQKYFNTGLADARNIGAEMCRAPYLFMLDADNLVTPRALRFLFETIERGQYAAVYSLLCRFRGTPENGIGLLSYYDWDPEILVQAPYVDAMALFRRDILLELGGYDHTLSEIGWFGWEDYDMWLRFAQRNLSVGFVPNILCYYRHHEASMINTTNLFSAELVRLFQERYGSLAAHYPAREQLFGVDRQKLDALQPHISAKELTPVR
jgi:glycosyltransferase involved in cell wall biosynthesis